MSAPRMPVAIDLPPAVQTILDALALTNLARALRDGVVTASQAAALLDGYAEHMLKKARAA